MLGAMVSTSWARPSLATARTGGTRATRQTQETPRTPARHGRLLVKVIWREGVGIRPFGPLGRTGRGGLVGGYPIETVAREGPIGILFVVDG